MTLLRLYYFVLFSSLGMLVPYFPAWLRAQGIDGLRMSAITALNPLLGMVAPVAFGVAADRFGLRGSLLRIAAAGALVPMSVVAALTLAGHPPAYGALLALVATFAFFRAPLVSIADVTALEDPGSYGRTRLFGSAGFMLTAVAAGALLDPTSRGALPVVVCVGLAGTLAVATRLPPGNAGPPRPVLDEARRLVRSADFLLLLLCGFLWFGAHVSYDLCFSLHLADLGAGSGFTGLAWAVGVVAEIALMSRVHALFERHPPSRLLALGLGATTVRLVLLSRVRVLPALLLLQPLHALSFALVWVSGLELVKRLAPSRVLATAQSLFGTATSLGSVLGMLTWGPLYRSGGGGGVFALAAAVAAPSVLAALALGRAAGAGRAAVAPPG